MRITFLSTLLVGLAGTANAKQPPEILLTAEDNATFTEAANTGVLAPLANPAGATTADPSLQAMTTCPSGTVYAVDFGDFPDGPVQVVEISATGTVVGSVPITYQNQDVNVADGIACSSAGDVYVSFHADEPGWFQSGHLGLLDPITGEIDTASVIKMTGGAQNDGDMIEWVGPKLFLGDIIYGSRTELYTVNLVTGALTDVGDMSVIGVAYEIDELAECNGTLYANGSPVSNLSTASFMTINTSNAKAKLIGAPHAVAYGLTRWSGCN